MRNACADCSGCLTYGYSRNTDGRLEPLGRVRAPLYPHQRRVYIYLLSLVHSVADAEELLQETAYILWKKFDEFRPGTNFGAWACRVAYLEAAKFRERHKGELPLSPQFLERIAQRSAEVSDLLELPCHVFNYCMDRLSELDRQLITRRVYTRGPGADNRGRAEPAAALGLEIACAESAGRCWSASAGGCDRRRTTDDCCLPAIRRV